MAQHDGGEAMKTGLEGKSEAELVALHRMASNGTYLFQSSNSLKHNGAEWYDAAVGLRALVDVECCRRRLGVR